MKFLQSLSAQVSLRTQGAILALGLLFIILDALTEPMNPAIDLAWVTVIICGLPLLINSVQSILDHLEIHANFLIVIAMVALIAIGDYHTAAYVGIIVHGGFFLEQLITGDVHYTLDDDMLPTMPTQLVALRQGINNYSSVIVVAGFVAFHGFLCIDAELYAYHYIASYPLPMLFGTRSCGTHDGFSRR